MPHRVCTSELLLFDPVHSHDPIQNNKSQSLHTLPTINMLKDELLNPGKTNMIVKH